MPAFPRPASVAIGALAATVAIAAALSGCASDWSAERPAPAPLGELKPGFLPAVAPSPEATITPDPGSWSDVRPAPGYRVVLLRTDENRPATTVADAVRAWAAGERVDLREIEVGAHPIDAIVEAMDQKPDLIVSAGDALVDPLALVTASHLDRQFLMLGAEVPEPTANVTAVDWTGASFRGQGLATSSAYDPSTFTRERADRAVRAGAAAVLHDARGIVVWID